MIISSHMKYAYTFNSLERNKPSRLAHLFKNWADLERVEQAFSSASQSKSTVSFTMGEYVMEMRAEYRVQGTNMKVYRYMMVVENKDGQKIEVVYKTKEEWEEEMKGRSVKEAIYIMVKGLKEDFRLGRQDIVDIIEEQAAKDMIVGYSNVETRNKG